MGYTFCFPVNSTKRKEFTITFQPNHGKLLVQTYSHYIIKLSLYCTLSQEVPCHQKDGRLTG